jgi:hypothetical protein
MPNSANQGKPNKNAGQGTTGDRDTRNSSSKPNPERSDVKHGDHEKSHRGDTSRSSNQGRKEASGGEAE